MTKDEFYTALAKHNLVLSDLQKERLARYYTLLVEKNKVMNLTAITNEEEVYEKHFYDSLIFSFDFDLANKSLIDVGTGAGFPGLVLAICYPTLKVTLLDALNKRCNFLQEVVDELKLDNVNIICSRSEDYALNHREVYDIAIARAVSRLNILLEICTPLVKVNGYFIALKGSKGREELEEAKNAFNPLSIKLEKVQEDSLFSDNDTRINLFIKKENKTNQSYPRPFAKIKKKPL